MRGYSRLLLARRRTGSADLPGLTAPVRLDRRTKNLTRRLQPGDLAVIDHADLDRVSAESLVHCQVAAVINVAPSITGRYPNLGPQLLVDAGIPLIDDVGQDVFDKIGEGRMVRLDGDTLYSGETIVAKGTVQTTESIAAAMAKAKDGLADQIRAFMANTVEYIGRDFEELIDGIRVPDLRTKLDGKHALVVARGYRHREDLHTLRAYIREFKPVMVAVDGGADALLEAGYLPHLIVGDMDSVSDRALTCGAEIVVHAYPDGRAPGLERVKSLGLDAVLCPATGHQRGRRAAAVRRGRGQADRRRRHAVHAGRVPGQRSAGNGQRDLDQDAGRRQDRRAEGRQPAVPQPGLDLLAGHARAGGSRHDGGRAVVPAGRPHLHQADRPATDPFWHWLTGLFH